MDREISVSYHLELQSDF